MRSRFMVLLALVIPIPASAAPGDFWCVRDEYRYQALDVKEGPDPSSDTIMVVGAGRQLVELGTQGDWLMVGVHRAKGRTGYVPKDSIQSTDLDGMRCGT